MLKIVILEDDLHRREAMRRHLQDRFHQYQAVFFDDAQQMISFLKVNLASALIISLDHDLVATSTMAGNGADLGTGRQVADFLALQTPVCPVIIATTNSMAGDGMQFLLEEAHWETHRVFPWGDLDWISTWFRTLRNAVVHSARPRALTKN